jgi:hypothetical protein
VSELLQSLIQTGRVADLLIAVLLAEAAVLVGLRMATGRGFAASYVISNLLAGLFLVLALRTALTDASWIWTALSLAAAGIAHAVDLAVRWPSA